MRIGFSEGYEKLWGGILASLILVSNPAIKFTAYEYLKRILLPPTESQLSPAKAFFIGALASAIATVITYPIQVVQTKARVSSAILGTGYLLLLLLLSFSWVQGSVAPYRITIEPCQGIFHGCFSLGNCYRHHLPYFGGADQSKSKFSDHRNVVVILVLFLLISCCYSCPCRYCYYLPHSDCVDQS